MAEINLTNEESFDLVNSKLTENYNSILNNMSVVSNMIKSNPENNELKELLYNLSLSASEIIGTQISFTYSYADKEYRDSMVDRLMEKRKNLLQEVTMDLENSNNVSRGR